VYELKRFAILVFAAIALLAGISTSYGVFQMWSGSQDFLTTQGTIKSLEFRRSPFDKDDVLYDLHFEFQVNGKTHLGFYLSPDKMGGFIDTDTAEHYRQKFLPGMVATVYYDPALPESRSFLEPLTLRKVLVRPLAALALGFWILYLLRMTRARSVPKRVLANQHDPNSPRWLAIYQTVLQQEQLTIQGRSWFARSNGISQWPQSRVGLVATPNTIAVVRGPFTPLGLLAAVFTAILEFFVYFWIGLIHSIGFLGERSSRSRTWKKFLASADPEKYTSAEHSAEIVPIDDTLFYGFDERKNVLWFRLPSRPVDDWITIRSDQAEQVEQFMAFVNLMQQSNRIENVADT